MAGADPSGSFDAATFRSQIRATMKMGLPNAQALQPTFRWVVSQQYAQADPAGHPYNWSEAASPGGPQPIPDIQVPCAVQIGSGSIEGTEAGFENELNARVTLLDEDQQTLIANGGRMPDQVVLAGSPYNVDYVLQEALFTVDVYILYCSAVDQT